MTDAPSQWAFRAYEETEEHYTARMAAVAPDAPAPPPPDYAATAREHLSQAVARDGYAIDLSSVRVESREPVVVDDRGNHRPPLVNEKPTGHIVTWTATGHERVATDAGDPVVEETEGRYLIPEPLASTGGAARLRHGHGGEVTALAFHPDGSPANYLLATDLDANTLHVEFFADTAWFTVTPDQ